MSFEVPYLNDGYTLVSLLLFLKFCPKWIQAPIFCLLVSEERVWVFELPPQLWRLAPIPYCPSAAPDNNDFTHPAVPLEQECRELVLCIRPLDLLRGDMVMGTGCREPFSGKWFLPGLGKHSLNPHIKFSNICLPDLGFILSKLYEAGKQLGRFLINVYHHPKRNLFFLFT